MSGDCTNSTESEFQQGTSPSESGNASGVLSSLWLLPSSLLSLTSTSTPTVTKSQEANSPTVQEKEKTAPEAYHLPAEVPTFKVLQKKRLSGTRTKQLLRAASRAHDDAPPPPELGSCCGSSCDPCVNDLWREEKTVWKERWGDRADESCSREIERSRGLEW